MITWSALRSRVDHVLRENQTLDASRPLMLVDSARQCLHWVKYDSKTSCSYPISTAKNGLGNRIDSFKTPTGIHRIWQKIGEGQPSGMIFKARASSGQIATNLDVRDRDEITSRILWLDGLEAGINRDGDCDTRLRYIYIHGTSDEARIGSPVSAGCIRMTNADIITLFDQIRVNDLVVIE